MIMHIRSFQQDDALAVADIINAVFPDSLTTPEQVRQDDERRDPKINFARFVAELDGRLVGYALHTQFLDYYHPQKFVLRGAVLPEYRQRGVGSALYEQVLAALASHSPRTLQAYAREDRDFSTRFLQQRGFVEVWRRYSSSLDLTGVQVPPFVALEKTLQARGIVIRTIAQLATDPERDEKLHALNTELEADVPIGQDLTPLSFDEFKAERIHNPVVLRDAFFVALDGERYVGMSSLWRDGTGKHLDVDFTGVQREYRGQQIALALKVLGLRYAQQQGYVSVRTTNDPQNAPMLAINAKLGFVRDPAVIRFEKEVSRG